MMTRNVYILGGLRSHIGICNGMYRHIPAQDLGAAVLRNIIKKYALIHVDMIICGNAVSGGGNVTRLMALTAGLSEAVPAVTIDMQCSSGLESIAIGAAKIAAGQADIVIAGGFESASTQPMRVVSPNHPAYTGANDTYMTAQFMPGLWREQIMVETAEETAIETGITRDLCDAWALRSHTLAKAAADADLLSDIQVSIDGSCRDEGIRKHMSEKLLRRMPLILPNGRVQTAGNTCLTHDGAAMVVLCSHDYAAQHGVMPVGEIVDTCAVGVSPLRSPLGAVTSIGNILTANDLTEAAIDCFEVNEAFACIDELFARAYPTCVDRYNILGGALAYGHPYGATGAILVLHALKALALRQGRLGCCSIAGAGGLGTAMLIKRCEREG